MPEHSTLFRVSSLFATTRINFMYEFSTIREECFFLCEKSRDASIFYAREEDFKIICIPLNILSMLHTCSRVVPGQKTQRGCHSLGYNSFSRTVSNSIIFLIRWSMTKPRFRRNSQSLQFRGIFQRTLSTGGWRVSKKCGSVSLTANQSKSTQIIISSEIILIISAPVSGFNLSAIWRKERITTIYMMWI